MPGNIVSVYSTWDMYISSVLGLSREASRYFPFALLSYLINNKEVIAWQKTSIGIQYKNKIHRLLAMNTIHSWIGM